MSGSLCGRYRGKASGTPVDQQIKPAQIENLRLLIETAGCGEEPFVNWMHNTYGDRKGVGSIDALEQIPPKLYDAGVRKLAEFAKNRASADKAKK